MSKYKDILRYLFTAELSNRAIARSLHVSRDTVQKARTSAQEKGISWEEVKSKTEDEIVSILFSSDKTVQTIYYSIDAEYYAKEYLRPGVTKKLLWEEYIAEASTSGKIPYQYSKFCDALAIYMKSLEPAYHKSHTPGMEVEVDWAGTVVPLYDPETGEVGTGYLFVGVLPFSQYAYAEVMSDMKLPNWIEAHARMFSFFNGVPSLLICDNLKTGITNHNRIDEWIENSSYREMADYYDIAILPTGVRAPKEKASAEGSVGKLTTQIIARMRNKVIPSITEANKYCREYLTEFNTKPFQKRDGSRLSEYLEYDKPSLKQLPAEPYEYGIWKIATVQRNYHIAVDKMNYSVPFQLIGKKVNVRITTHSIEIYQNQERITSHKRLYGRANQYSTKEEHMPPSHQEVKGWSGEYFRKWARKYGESTYLVIDRLLHEFSLEQQGYKGCSAILHLANRYTPERVEEATAMALSLKYAPRYRDIKQIFDYLQDQDKKKNKNMSESTDHAIIRGSGYYGGNKNG